ncbi:hypothetical protein FRC12_003678 [Ceratobasidium sp. 428]|nr:hypothetical protein FRC12_003678 [Ceratobasidium sp. 428]
MVQTRRQTRNDPPATAQGDASAHSTPHEESSAVDAEDNSQAVDIPSLRSDESDAEPNHDRLNVNNSPSADPEHSSESEGNRAADEEESDDETSDHQAKGRRGRPIGAKDWKPWEDRALAHEALAMEMWKVGRTGEKSTRAWDSLAAAIANKDRSFQRIGTACRKRFHILLTHEKNVETRALQTTGEGEDIENHLEVMGDILVRFRDHESQREEKSSTAKAKAELEKTAGAEMRDAAMKDLVRRDDLTDVTRIKGATAREKGGQRTERKRAKSNPDAGARSKKARMDVTSELQDIVAERNASDKATIEEANRLDQERHDETTHILEGLTGELRELTNTLKEDYRRRGEDEVARRAENKALWSVVKSAVNK